MNEVALELVLAYITQANLARELNITESAIYQWRHKRIPVYPVNRVIQIEKLLGGRVTRNQMRPDIYPEE